MQLCAGSVAVAATAIVIREQTPLRAEPRDSGKQQAVLWQGEAVEVRGERMDYVQVYDHRRERGGFVRASHVRRVELTAAEAPELLAIVRFLREAPGSDALGIGLAAAYIQAAPAAVLQGEGGADALEALGTFAERLASRASSTASQSKSADAVLSSQLDVAARYGVGFVSFESAGRIRMCYDGDAFRRLQSTRASPQQRARAALALTRPDCIDPAMRPLDRVAVDEKRAQILDQIDASTLPGYLKNRVLMRRAGIAAGLAYHRARKGEPAEAVASRALRDLASVGKSELTDDDKLTYADAAMRVNASRWAAVSGPAAAGARGLQIVTAPGQPGETCVLLIDAKHDAAHALARRCTYGIVWEASFTVNREGTAAAVAVQHMDAWRELWIVRKTGSAWTLGVLPPAAIAPELGYAEFAGWVPGGQQVLVAREARGEGTYKRAFEVRRLDTLAIERQSSEPAVLGAFRRWQDPSWKAQTVSLR
jgi:hypothetical protein